MEAPALCAGEAFGDLAPGEERTNGPGDRFQLLVAADAGAQTLSLDDIRTATLAVTANWP